MKGRASTPTSMSLYRDFCLWAEDVLGADGLYEELVSSSGPEGYRLPRVVTAEDALALGRAFYEVYVKGNPYRRALGGAGEGIAVDLFGATALMLSEYMALEDLTFGSVDILLEIESVDRAESGLDLLFEQVSQGLRCTPATSVEACDQKRVVDEDEVRRFTGHGVPKGEVYLWSNMRRRSDGAVPAENVHEDGSHGFAPEEDDAVALHKRYRDALPAERLAAVEELRGALAYAADPRRQRACDVAYSLLEALEASACRSLMRGGACSEPLLRECQLGFSRCMQALRDETGRKGEAL